MNMFFLKIINMSIAASWLVLAVLVLRQVIKKAPKWANVLLWGIVAVRLVCPFSVESDFSLIPSAQTLPEKLITGPSFDVNTGIPPVDTMVNDYLGDRYFEGATVPADNGADTMTILAIVWIAGILILAAYTLISYIRIQRQTETAVLYNENIYQSENVNSPFVLGVVRPRIYLPFNIDEQTFRHVVAHEQAHISRRDHWWKPFGFLLLMVHWFNPLMWVAYALFCRDIELACDEKVIRELDNQQRADYSQALVSCSINRPVITACPLAFGEVSVKDRVRSVMNYRKPKFWIVITAVVLCMAAAVCFLTDPFVPSIYDVFTSGRYNVLNQKDINLTLSVPKSSLPESIYTSEGHTFSPEEVIAYKEDGTAIYLHKAMLSNENDDLLYFFFDFSHDFGKYGSFPSPYKYVPGPDSIQSHLLLASSDLKDIKGIYPETVFTRSFGPGTQFGFYVSKDACRNAVGNIMIDIACNRVFYEEKSRKKELVHGGLNAEIVEIDQDNSILYVRDIIENIGIFGDRCALDLNRAMSKLQLFYVNYDSGHLKDIEFTDFQVGDSIIIYLRDSEFKKALNNTAVAEQVQLDTQRINDSENNPHTI